MIMQLILREYLAELKERDELDALLPELLSEMGMNVLTKPMRGTRQQGVDISAIGQVEGQDTLFLFSVKDGDLNRSHWNSGDQALRPSLDDILDVYIPNRVIEKFQNLPIVICLCFGGAILETVLENVTGYIKNKTTDKIHFEIWNGDKIAQLIEAYLLKENLLPKSYDGYLRRMLALIDEPEISVSNFTCLINEILTEANLLKEEKRLQKLRQIYLSLYVLYSWCRQGNNLESAFQCSEIALLTTLHQVKMNFQKEKKNTLDDTMIAVYESIYQLYRKISSDYVEKVIVPHAHIYLGLSNGSTPLNSVDTNLKLFDLLGRLAIEIMWCDWEIQNFNQKNEDLIAKKFGLLKVLVSLIDNNPTLYLPYKDDFHIEIFLAFTVLIKSGNNQYIAFAKRWLVILVDRIAFNLNNKQRYPIIFKDYDDLIRHPKDGENYFQEATAASILYPILMFFISLFDDKELTELFQNHLLTKIPHCTHQLWYLRTDSEDKLHTFDTQHGAIQMDVDLSETVSKFSDLININFDIEKIHLNNISYTNMGFDPLLFLACRHYRHPIPAQYLTIN